MSHTSGHNNSTSSASGQQMMKSTSHSSIPIQLRYSSRPPLATPPIAPFPRLSAPPHHRTVATSALKSLRPARVSSGSRTREWERAGVCGWKCATACHAERNDIRRATPGARRHPPREASASPSFRGRRCTARGSAFRGLARHGCRARGYRDCAALRAPRAERSRIHAVPRKALPRAARRRVTAS